MRRLLWLGLLFAIGAGLASYALGRGWLGVRQDGEHSVSALSTERSHDLCRNECYNPSDERRHITR